MQQVDRDRRVVAHPVELPLRELPTLVRALPETHVHARGSGVVECSSSLVGSLSPPADEVVVITRIAQTHAEGQEPDSQRQADAGEEDQQPQASS